jgi:hypothetical protein
MRRARRKRLTRILTRQDEPLPGIRPATIREILAYEAEQPMRGGNAELTHTSLFGDSHSQQELPL